MTPFDRRANRASALRIALPLVAGMLAALPAPPAASAQQSLERRIAEVRGAAELRFAARPGVCGNGEGSFSLRSQSDGLIQVQRSGGRDFYCEPGPVRVRLEVSNGTVTSVRSYVGVSRGSSHPGGVTDLGMVGAREAAEYFLGLARSADEQVARKAIVPAALADSVTVWPGLIELGRDRDRSAEVRKSALFWAGQLGETEVLEPVSAVATDPSENESVRKQAVFVLSQLPDGAGIDALISIARSDPDHSVRKRAFFWLGQTDDPRVIELLTSILEK